MSLACASLLSTPAFAADLTGAWVLDTTRSDDVSEVQAAQGALGWLIAAQQRVGIQLDLVDTHAKLEETQTTSIFDEQQTLKLDDKDRRHTTNHGVSERARHWRTEDGRIESILRWSTPDGTACTLEIVRTLDAAVDELSVTKILQCGETATRSFQQVFARRR